jgi:hypothetical protein
MRGKSRRGHGKQAARGKKRRAVVTGASPLPVASKEDSSDVPVLATPLKPVALEATAGGRSPDILMELRRIGILAGIVLVILIVLALVLP